MRPASVETKSDLSPKFWADPDLRTVVGRIVVRAAAVVALRRGAPRRKFGLMTLKAVPEIPLGC